MQRVVLQSVKLGLVAGLAVGAGGAAMAPAMAGTISRQSASEDRPTHFAVTRDLRLEPVTVSAFDLERITFLADGRPRERRVAEILALFRTDSQRGSGIEMIGTLPGSTRPVLELTDGQRIHGQIEAADAATHSEGRITWRSDTAGVLEVPLEQVHRVRLVEGEAIANGEPGRGDMVRLINGDRITGFVTRIGKVVGIEPEGERRELELPLERVAQVQLTNPVDPLAREASTARLWVSDGSVIDVRHLSWDGANYDVRLTTVDHHETTEEGVNAVTRGIELVRAVLFPGASILALADLEVVSVKGPHWLEPALPPRILRDDVLLGLADVEITGPVEVKYRLPSGAGRFAAEVELPATDWTWGDVDFVLKVDDTEVLRKHLDGTTPLFNATAALPVGETLWIVIEEAGNGPVQDRVILRRPMIRVD